MPQTLYQILDVTEAASDKEIKAAYRQAVLRHHPDKSAALGTPADALKYQELQNAWQVSAYAVLHMLHVCAMVFCQERSTQQLICVILMITPLLVLCITTCFLCKCARNVPLDQSVQYLPHKLCMGQKLSAKLSCLAADSKGSSNQGSIQPAASPCSCSATGACLSDYQPC